MLRARDGKKLVLASHAAAVNEPLRGILDLLLALLVWRSLRQAFHARLYVHPLEEGRLRDGAVCCSCAKLDCGPGLRYILSAYHDHRLLL